MIMSVYGFDSEKSKNDMHYPSLHFDSYSSIYEEFNSHMKNHTDIYQDYGTGKRRYLRIRLNMGGGGGSIVAIIILSICCVVCCVVCCTRRVRNVLRLR